MGENAPLPSSARKTPIEQKTKLSMMRGLKKADCEEGFFFMIDSLIYVQVSIASVLVNAGNMIAFSAVLTRCAFAVPVI